MPISKATWRRGLDSQCACNLSGLAQFLPRLLGELRANGINDTALNTHTLVRLVVAQLAYLAFGNFDCGVGDLWHRAYQLAEMETRIHPLYDRPLEPGEKESILAAWAEEERSA
jgi:hypothetical protein